GISPPLDCRSVAEVALTGVRGAENGVKEKGDVRKGPAGGKEIVKPDLAEDEKGGKFDSGEVTPTSREEVVKSDGVRIEDVNTSGGYTSEVLSVPKGHVSGTEAVEKLEEDDDVVSQKKYDDDDVSSSCVENEEESSDDGDGHVSGTEAVEKSEEDDDEVSQKKDDDGDVSSSCVENEEESSDDGDVSSSEVSLSDQEDCNTVQEATDITELSVNDSESLGVKVLDGMSVPRLPSSGINNTDPIAHIPLEYLGSKSKMQNGEFGEPSAHLEEGVIAEEPGITYIPVLNAHAGTENTINVMQ
ncbi:hypothetical protein U1Q18_037376, partial [Sarracenia purpurea var. burkii]